MLQHLHGDYGAIAQRAAVHPPRSFLSLRDGPR
jgi:hypothetical protein